MDVKALKPRLYIETTIVSYLAARPSRDLIVAAHQQLTWEWWSEKRASFDLFTSQSVIREASAGDTNMARRRLELLEGIPILSVHEGVARLGRTLVEARAVPQKAEEDALHIAVAAVHGMEYLVTWNCRHIANAQIQRTVAMVCREAGYEPAVICTPEELMGV